MLHILAPVVSLDEIKHSFRHLVVSAAWRLST